MDRPVRIAPSILAADFARFGDEVKAVAAAGADLIHVDVMDGHFVPNITIGPSTVAALRKETELPLDVHLMIAPVDPFIDAFADAGANYLTVHPEAGPHLHRTLQLIRDRGCHPGVALNPGTPVEAVLPVLDLIDLVLIMSVNPGFGGQAFIPETLQTASKLRGIIDSRGLDVALEIDGGINPQTAPDAVAAGIDIMVAGTAVFRGGPEHYAQNILSLRE